jgi:NAD(P)-dependent dehydrogenase (short-subunit alcohol dehydrogenase family)
MNKPITDWRGKRVWLLGASSGIGAALARALLSEGARVAVSARSAAKLEALVRDRPAGLVLPCDVADPGSIAAAWQSLLHHWQGVDLAIYIAGDYVPMRAWALDMAAAQRMIDVNLVGAVNFAACVVPQLLAQDNAPVKGEIAFVASVAGYRGLPKSLIYGPTKAALINFAEALAIDLQPRGVGVRLINPGFVATPLTAEATILRCRPCSRPRKRLRRSSPAIAAAPSKSIFPKRFTYVMKLLALLPARLYFPLVRRLTGV